jgi:hypothetical protein
MPVWNGQLLLDRYAVRVCSSIFTLQLCDRQPNATPLSSESQHRHVCLVEVTAYFSYREY